MISVADIPPPLLVLGLLKYFDKRKIFITFFGIQSLAGLSVALFFGPNSSGWIFPILIAICRGGVTATFATVWIVHPQMFPTLFAVTSLGISNLTARFFVILAPIIGEQKFPYPMYAFTGLTLISLVASYFLQERPLEDLTTDDAPA